MKKAILLTFGICFMSVQFSLAQVEKNVPPAVTAAFQAKYPNMTVTDWDWEDDKDAYEAEFKMDGREMEAYFTAEGEWKKTKSEVKREQVPAAVTKGMASGEYGSWTMSDFMEMDTPEGKRYKAKAKKGNQEHYLKFDNNGKLLEKKDKAEKKADKTKTKK